MSEPPKFSPEFCACSFRPASVGSNEDPDGDAVALSAGGGDEGMGIIDEPFVEGVGCAIGRRVIEFCGECWKDAVPRAARCC